MATTMSGLDMVRGLVQRGYSPYQAAALAGHALQESGGDPTNVNKAEDAHGLLQWRGSRWQALQDYAKSKGTDPTDPQTQLDFIGQEMQGPEAKAGAGFKAATDVASASAALKPYIRFGDSSAPTRLSNASGLLAQYNGGGQVGELAGPRDPVSPIDPTSTAGAPVSLSAPVGALAQGAPPSTADILSTAAGKLAPQQGGGQSQQPEFLPLQQMQMPQANIGQSQQIAQAIARSYGWT